MEHVDSNLFLRVGVGAVLRIGALLKLVWVMDAELLSILSLVVGLLDFGVRELALIPSLTVIRVPHGGTVVRLVEESERVASPVELVVVEVAPLIIVLTFELARVDFEFF